MTRTTTPSGEPSPVPELHVSGDSVVVPDPQLLFSGEFSRAGQDLAIGGDDGSGLVLRGYFDSDSPPDLTAPNGAWLDGGTVGLLAGPQAPGQYAQTGSVGGESPVGTVAVLEGSATVQRTDGTVHQLQEGDSIFQGDVLHTGDGAELAVEFIDETLFQLQANTRMVVDELVYGAEGSSNSALFSFLQGTFSMVAGQIAPSGNMEVATPVATMGIRGTAIVGVEVDGAGYVGLIVDHEDHIGLLAIYDNATGDLVTTIDSVTVKVSLTGGQLSLAPLSPDELSLNNQLMEALHQLVAAVQEDEPEEAPGNSPQTDDPPDAGIDPDAPLIQLNLRDEGAALDDLLDDSALEMPEPLIQILTLLADPQTVEQLAQQIEAAQPEILTEETIAERTLLEQENVTSGDAELVAGGIIAFGDDGPTSSHIVSFVADGDGYLGIFDLGEVDQDANTVTWSFKVNDADLDPLAAGQEIVQTYTVTIDDGEGGSVDQKVTVTIAGSNDKPVISVTDSDVTGAVTENADDDFLPSQNTLVTGQIVFADVDTGDTPEASVDTSVAGLAYIPSGGSESELPAEFDATAILGAFSITTSGAWSYDASAIDLEALGSDDVIRLTYTVTVTDDHGAEDTQEVVITIGGSNDAPVITSVDKAELDEDRLTGETEAAADSTFTGEIAVDFVDGVPESLEEAFSFQATGLDGQLETTDGTPVIFEIDDDGILIGSAGHNEVIRIEITGASEANGEATFNYQVTLGGSLKHVGDEGVSVVLGGVEFEIEDGSGSSVLGSFDVEVIDDTPVADSNTAAVDANSPKTVDVQLIIDLSGSMSTTVSAVPNDFGDDRIGLARYSMQQLIQSNEQIGHVQFIQFSSDATGTAWMSREDALAFVEDDANWVTGGTTDYDAALAAAMDEFGAPREADETVVYFLSDGDPTQGGGITDDSSGSDVSTADWENFVADNDISRVFAIGIGQGVAVENLEPISYPNDGEPEENVVSVGTENVGDLVATLQDLLGSAEIASGNVLENDGGTGSGGDEFGADGGYIRSIEIDGVTYTYGPDAGAVLAEGSAPSGFKNNGTWVAVPTVLGGVLTFYFASTGDSEAGDWSYRAPNSAGTEVFEYTLEDGDGDTASATLTIKVEVEGAVDPVLLDLGDPGIHLSGAVAFDMNGDGDPQSIAWPDSGDGILVLDLDGSGAIESGREVFSPWFSDGGFADALEALASLDTDGDGIIDAQDEAFGSLRVWVDGDGDGLAKESELSFLYELGIDALPLDAQEADYHVNDSQVVAEGQFTYADGSSGRFMVVNLKELAEPTLLGSHEIASDESSPVLVESYSGDAIRLTSANSETSWELTLQDVFAEDVYLAGFDSLEELIHAAFSPGEIAGEANDPHTSQDDLAWRSGSVDGEHFLVADDGDRTFTASDVVMRVEWGPESVVTPEIV